MMSSGLGLLLMLCGLLAVGLFLGWLAWGPHRDWDRW